MDAGCSENADQNGKKYFEFDTYYIPSGLELYLDLDYAIQ